MNRPAFYAALRQRGNTAFGTSLSQRQVDGLEALLTAAHGLPIDHAAHVLAECHHETGGGMYPVKETVFAYSKDKNPTDAQVIARLDAAYRKGQLTWVKTPYWRTGWFGRGMIQLTHEANYRKLSPVVGVDLVSRPDRALHISTSARIAVEGCRLGLFTGRKLADYDTALGYDHVGARAIVNGDVRAVGPKIEKLAGQFEAALDAAGWGDASPPAPAQPDPAEQGGWLSSLVAAILSLFGKGKA